MTRGNTIVFRCHTNNKDTKFYLDTKIHSKTQLSNADNSSYNYKKYI